MALKRLDSIRPVRWDDGALVMVDQRLLPRQYHEHSYRDAGAVAQAITDMVVRGAPAIGIAAAFGVVLAARARYQQVGTGWRAAIEQDLTTLAASRPTAVNLFWALARMRRAVELITAGDPYPPLLAEAQRIHDEDIAANYTMGELGAALIDSPCAVMTHCNAGALATGGYGTALGVIRSGFQAGRIRQVYADETRPWLQGARLTAWELHRDGIPVALVCEGAGAHLMKQGDVKWLIVGSDRIAANGDVANKIGTYHAAIAARHHGVKVMVVAPTSTIDMTVAHGDAIPIERRGEDEVLSLAGQRVAADGVGAWNPVFDVTPAALVDAIVTEKGVVLRPDAGKMASLMGGR
ncbi:MAG: S-methyl-5-thioribose-1-phosphate isomerase [Gammaproteobacteria bacterium]|nr:S-methyl-5-thioribose-1-phosphate isomerase [Gammaproteobacteria bacterium]